MRERIDRAALRVSTSRREVPPTGSLSAYLALAERFGRDEVFLLESAAGSVRDRRYRFTGFGALLTVAVTGGVVRVEGVPEVRDAVLARLRPLLDGDADGREGGGPRLRRPRDLWQVLRAVGGVFDARGSASRFRFGFLGYFGYDTARYIEDLPYLIEGDDGMADVYLVLHRGCLVVDLATGRSELLLHECPAWPALDPAEIAALVGDADRTHPEPVPAPVPEAWMCDDTDAARFARNVERCLKHIAVGDIYQVQIGHELTVASAADPLDVYLRLRARNASPYMYLTSVDGHTVVGASPELFVRVEDGAVTMRPIAGTVPRSAGGDESEDDALAARLREDPKEVAEHTMLVDLCRNDIGRICARDSLGVRETMVVERYSHVQHLVSTVTGRAEGGVDAFDVIRALFPAGTMTGTPKIRAMEIIEELETTRRGLYAGALGLIDVGGYVNLALCIRTLIHRDGVYRTRASAGVVADSSAEREWTETLAKSSAAYWAVTGRELL
ncbi:anthranilate synthase component I family protein [Microbispora sp. ATCC PTA-5024]|uniref:anthranilate synthase component I family protein n=1 Tax=Microbispora sp. ATCC PTA-5024 TaxID=316330 RepID=UPI0003F8B5A5|nr:anthranilate synthase component I family protein [Microbispora sp. ATCC PTA-5024]